jgi:hypothetical protein
VTIQIVTRTSATSGLTTKGLAFLASAVARAIATVR